MQTQVFRPHALTLALMPTLCFLSLAPQAALAQDGQAGGASSGVPAGAAPASGQSPANPTGAATPSPAGEPPSSTAPLQEAIAPAADAKPYYAAGGEGKTLPERVIRLRLPFRFASAKTGYDKDGKKEDLGLELSLAGTAAVIEYGVTDKLSVQMLMPWVLHNKVGLTASKFRESAIYKKSYSDFINAAARLLAANGQCTSFEACLSAIDNGQKLPTATPVTLPNGETFVASSILPIKSQADSLVINGLKQSPGKTGTGDLELGALYNILSEAGPFTGSPMHVSAGLGLRLPTGQFTDVPAGYRSTGRGTTDLGLRLNLDYNPLAGVWLSAQNQTERMLVGGKKKGTSLVDNTNTYGDAKKFERKGLRNVGFLRAVWGLGNITQTLKMIGVNTMWKYDIDAPEYIDGTLQAGRKQAYAWTTGLSLDGLAYRIPAQLDVDYDMPIAGKNNRLAASILGITLKGYYRF